MAAAGEAYVHSDTFRVDAYSKVPGHGTIEGMCVLDNGCMLVSRVGGGVYAISPWGEDIARLTLPEDMKSARGMAVYRDNTVLVCDSIAHVIWRMAPSGRHCAPFAGRPGVGGWRDGDVADGLLLRPAACAVSPCGSFVCIADSGNHCLRLVDSRATYNPVLRTIAGCPGVAGYVDAPLGTGLLNNPGACVWSADFVVFADVGNHAVRVAQWCGGGGGGDGAGVHDDSDGDGDYLHCDDAQAARDTWRVRTVAGGNGHAGWRDDAGSRALLNHPAAFAFTSTGALLVADRNNHRIRCVARGRVRTLCGGLRGTTTNCALKAAQFHTPSALVCLGINDTTFIADSGNNMIKVLRKAVSDAPRPQPQHALRGGVRRGSAGADAAEWCRGVLGAPPDEAPCGMAMYLVQQPVHHPTLMGGAGGGGVAGYRQQSRSHSTTGGDASHPDAASHPTSDIAFIPRYASQGPTGSAAGAGAAGTYAAAAKPTQRPHARRAGVGAGTGEAGPATSVGGPAGWGVGRTHPHARTAQPQHHPHPTHLDADDHDDRPREVYIRPSFVASRVASGLGDGHGAGAPPAPAVPAATATTATTARDGDAEAALRTSAAMDRHQAARVGGQEAAPAAAGTRQPHHHIHIHTRRRGSGTGSDPAGAGGSALKDGAVRRELGGVFLAWVSGTSDTTCPRGMGCTQWLRLLGRCRLLLASGAPPKAMGTTAHAASLQITPARAGVIYAAACGRGDRLGFDQFCTGLAMLARALQIPAAKLVYSHVLPLAGECGADTRRARPHAKRTVVGADVLALLSHNEAELLRLYRWFVGKHAPTAGGGASRSCMIKPRTHHGHLVGSGTRGEEADVRAQLLPMSGWLAFLRAFGILPELINRHEAEVIATRSVNGTLFAALLTGSGGDTLDAAVGYLKTTLSHTPDAPVYMCFPEFMEAVARVAFACYGGGGARGRHASAGTPGEQLAALFLSLMQNTGRSRNAPDFAVRFTAAPASAGGESPPGDTVGGIHDSAILSPASACPLPAGTPPLPQVNPARARGAAPADATSTTPYADKYRGGYLDPNSRVLSGRAVAAMAAAAAGADEGALSSSGGAEEGGVEGEYDDSDDSGFLRHPGDDADAGGWFAGGGRGHPRVELKAYSATLVQPCAGGGGTSTVTWSPDDGDDIVTMTWAPSATATTPTASYTGASQRGPWRAVAASTARASTAYTHAYTESNAETASIAFNEVTSPLRSTTLQQQERQRHDRTAAALQKGTQETQGVVPMALPTTVAGGAERDTCSRNRVPRAPSFGSTSASGTDISDSGEGSGCGGRGAGGSSTSTPRSASETATSAAFHEVPSTGGAGGRTATSTIGGRLLDAGGLGGGGARSIGGTTASDTESLVFETHSHAASRAPPSSRGGGGPAAAGIPMGSTMGTSYEDTESLVFETHSNARGGAPSAPTSSPGPPAPQTLPTSRTRSGAAVSSVGGASYGTETAESLVFSVVQDVPPLARTGAGTAVDGTSAGAAASAPTASPSTTSSDPGMPPPRAVADAAARYTARPLADSDTSLDDDDTDASDAVGPLGAGGDVNSGEEVHCPSGPPARVSTGSSWSSLLHSD